ncbi:SRPBCC family protein [Usitatibacter palustris]|uniref:Activator of Hsp90 ATPase homologue 1/2-like C-terminal domain-containing protein n=1 Tax=Usitatibacter palustris TaxID=2732487 RepID=A0A6M4H7N9_9PROT|nr:SRPBCC domain-containing protein [Usitatibacter palustris]QJR14007.1 hypothetical protein DSM104440_00799 [Usitatibacter palustris]
MTDKPVRKLELQVDIDAPIEEAWKALTEGQGIANWFPPIAKVDRPGLGGTVTLGWSAEMAYDTTVDSWQPNKQVRWLNNDMMGPGTALAAEWNLETVGGKTRVRLVQSGFGESEGWDSFFEGTEVGWTYFLYNLRLYLEKHRGKIRHMISERLEATAPRDAMWKRVVAAVGSTDAIKAGDDVQAKLGDKPTRAIVELAVARRALALRFPDLGDDVLFIELEGSSDTFHVGWWLSVYDAKRAAEMETPAKRAFRQVHESAT